MSCRKPKLGSAAVSGKAAAEAGGGGKASKWKQHSAQLRLAMQANKGGSKGEAAAAMLAETHQVSPHAAYLTIPTRASFRANTDAAKSAVLA